MINPYRKPHGRQERGEQMAKKLSIIDTSDILEIVIDDHKMTEVLSYKLEGSCGRSTLTVVTEILEEVTAKIEGPT